MMGCRPYERGTVGVSGFSSSSSSSSSKSGGSRTRTKTKTRIASLLLCLPRGDDDAAFGFFAFAVGEDVRVVRESGVNDAAVEGRHRIEDALLAGFLHTLRPVEGAAAEGFFAAGAIAIGIEDDADVFARALADHQRYQVLQSSQRIPLPPDDRREL